jgi:hypothetical protein
LAEDPLQIAPFFVQTNPISKTPKITANPVLTESYENKDHFTTDENEPNFSPVRSPQSQNEPNVSRRSHGEARTNPIFVPLVPFIVYKYLQRLAI